MPSSPPTSARTPRRTEPPPGRRPRCPRSRRERTRVRPPGPGAPRGSARATPRAAGPGGAGRIGPSDAKGREALVKKADPSLMTATTAAAAAAKPNIGNVQTAAMPDGTTTVTFTTDQPAQIPVRYGLSSTSLANVLSEPGMNTVHELIVPRLQPQTRYYYEVTGTNEIGSTTASVRSFTT